MDAKPLTAREKDFVGALIGAQLHAAVREIVISRGEGTNARISIEKLVREFLVEYLTQ